VKGGNEKKPRTAKNNQQASANKTNFNPAMANKMIMPIAQSNKSASNENLVDSGSVPNFKLV
jgi:hypothetical protein